MNFVLLLYTALTGVLPLFTNDAMGGAFGLLDDAILTIENIDKLKFLEMSSTSFTGVALALASTFATYGALKTFFVGFGIDADPPEKIAFRAAISFFMVFYLNEVLMIFVKIAGGITTGIRGDTKALNCDGFLELAKAAMNSPSGGVIMVFVGILFVVFLIIFFIKTYMRLIMCILLLAFAPFAAATIALSSTAGFFAGYIKLFVGNLIVQIMQMFSIVGLYKIMVFASSSNGPNSAGSSASLSFYMFAMIALLAIANKLEEITRDMTISSGLSGGGGLMSSMHSGMYAASGAMRFLGK